MFDRFLFSIYKHKIQSMKKLRLNYLTHHGSWHFEQVAHNHYFCSKNKSSGILTCITFMSYSYLFFVFGVHFFLFFIYIFLLSHLIFLLGLLPLFYFLFSNMGKQLEESKVCTYYNTNESQIKNYEPYYYRTLTGHKSTERIE